MACHDEYEELDWSRERVEGEIRRLAAERPDFVYRNQGADAPDGQACSYLGRALGDPAGQACIVGAALTNLGADRDDLEFYDGWEAMVMLEDLTGEPMSDWSWVNMVQAAQDMGHSWGRAVSSSDWMRENYDPSKYADEPESGDLPVRDGRRGLPREWDVNA